MASLPKPKVGGGLQEISHLLGEIDGRDASSSFSNGNDLVTMAMLDLMKKQLEENYSKEIKTLRAAFGVEVKIRKENETKFTKCISKLMEELERLNTMVTSVEERIEKVEQLNTNPPSSTTLETGRAEIQPIKKRKIKTKDNGLHIDIIKPSRPPTSVLVDYNMPSASPAPHENNKLNTAKRKTSDTTSIKNKAKASSKATVSHGDAKTPGRYLPLKCICGLEFDSDRSLADHAAKQFLEGPPLLSSHSKPHQDVVKPSTSKSSAGPGQPTLQCGSNTLSPITSPSISPKHVKANRENRHGKDPTNRKKRGCLCGMEFSSNLALHRHVKFKTEVNYLCKSCDKGFAFACHLQNHMKTTHRKFKRSKVGRKPKTLAKRWKVTQPSTGEKISKTGKQIVEGSPGSSVSSSSTHSNNDTMTRATSGTQHQQPGSTISQSFTSTKPSKAHQQNGHRLSIGQDLNSQLKSAHGSSKKEKKTHEADPNRPLYCLCGAKSRDKIALYCHVNYHAKKKAKQSKILN